MAICEKCVGKGLIGTGHQPWAMQGHITTCPDCTGTGVIADTEVTPEKEADQTVDKPIAESKLGGILSIFRRNK